jgi:hypothetical protein
MSACLSVTDSSGGSQEYFARIRGTVTRADGASAARAGVGVSCMGSGEQPFGATGEADANGRFEVDLNIPPVFKPLEGPVYACRVLTPYLGLPQVEKTVVIPVATGTRPVSEVALVIP